LLARKVPHWNIRSFLDGPKARRLSGASLAAALADVESVLGAAQTIEVTARHLAECLAALSNVGDAALFRRGR
jgi:hypothetical protein